MLRIDGLHLRPLVFETPSSQLEEVLWRGCTLDYIFSCVIRAIDNKYYLRSVPLVHFNFLVEVFLAFYRNVMRIL